MLNQKWDIRFLSMAKLVASWSKDVNGTQVGAVFVTQERRVISVGYNGFAQGIDDLEERYNDRNLKYDLVVHAEENGLIFANRDELKGCCLYTYPFMPCSRCAAKMIQAGIKRVVSLENNNPRWVDNFKLTIIQFSEKGIILDLYDPGVLND